MNHAKRTADVVKAIIILEQTAPYKLFGKTGAGPQANGKMLGWLVGYVETHDNVYFYALNFDGETFQALAEKLKTLNSCHAKLPFLRRSQCIKCSGVK